MCEAREAQDQVEGTKPLTCKQSWDAILRLATLVLRVWCKGWGLVSFPGLGAICNVLSARSCLIQLSLFFLPDLRRIDTPLTTKRAESITMRLQDILAS